MRPAALLVLCLAGCPGARPPVTHPTPSHTTSDAEPVLRPSELRVMHGDRVEGALTADGRIVVDGHDIARMEASRVVSAEGVELARLDSHTLHVTGTSQIATLADDGTVLGPDGRRMTLGEHGEVLFTDAASRDEHNEVRLRVEGLTAPSRPAAGVLLVVLMFRARSAATP